VIYHLRIKGFHLDQVDINSLEEYLFETKGMDLESAWFDFSTFELGDITTVMGSQDQIVTPPPPLSEDLAGMLESTLAGVLDSEEMGGCMDAMDSDELLKNCDDTLLDVEGCFSEGQLDCLYATIDDSFPVSCQFPLDDTFTMKDRWPI
jgi:hypothetical protein